jgi:hypothetical protein
LFSVAVHSFANEPVFLEVIDALLGITTESEQKRAAHPVDGYFVEDGKLWGATPRRAVSRRECVTQLEATQLAW